MALFPVTLSDPNYPHHPILHDFLPYAAVAYASCVWGGGGVGNEQNVIIVEANHRQRSRRCTALL